MNERMTAGGWARTITRGFDSLYSDKDALAKQLRNFANVLEEASMARDVDSGFCDATTAEGNASRDSEALMDLADELEDALCELYAASDAL